MFAAVYQFWFNKNDMMIMNFDQVHNCFTGGKAN